MRYTQEIEQGLLEQIAKEPLRPIVLPDWAYWADGRAVIHVGSIRVPLIRHLYGLVNDHVLPDWMGLRNAPGVPPRNVNPNLAQPLPRARSRFFCPYGHRFTPEDFTGVRHVCHVCLESHPPKPPKKKPGRPPICLLYTSPSPRDRQKSRMPSSA